MKRVLFAMILTWISMPGCAVDRPWRPIGARAPAGDLYDAIEAEQRASGDGTDREGGAEAEALTQPQAMPSLSLDGARPAFLQSTTN